MRCIDADKLKDKLYSLVDCDGNECLHIDVVIDVIDNEPEADVRENVRGKWIKKKGSLWSLATCSVCGELSVEGDKPFCPNCGAKMERR